MNNWNGLDFFIFLIFVLNTLLGIARGATKEIISMMCLSVGLIFAIKFTVPLAIFLNSSPLIMDVIDSEVTRNFMKAIGAGPLTADMLKQIAYSISLLICFSGVFCLCEAVLIKVGFVEVFSFPYATLNRKVGAVLGCTRGYVLTLLLIIIFVFHLMKNEPVNSYFVNLFRSAAIKFDRLIAEQNPDRYREVYEGKDIYNAHDVLKHIDNTNQFPTHPPANSPASHSSTQDRSSSSTGGRSTSFVTY